MRVTDRKPPATATGPMVRGSVVVHRRRCGKTNCRCAKSDLLHETTVLSYSEEGRTRLVVLPPGEIAAVEAAVDRYRSERARVEAAGNAGLAELVARLDADKRRARP